jgi:hypothetical protein
MTNSKQSLSVEELDALSRARLMVSGRYRISWTYAGDTAGSLIRKGLIDEGGYLTTAAIRSRSPLEDNSNG